MSATKKKALDPKKIMESLDIGPKLTIGGVSFDICKLPVMDGYRLSEQIREALALQSEAVEMPQDVKGEAVAATAFVKSVLTLPPSVVEKVRKTLFSSVTFKTKDVEQGWIGLLGAEDMAFESLETYHVYEVFGRCLLVNFSGSFTDILSRFQGLMDRLKASNPSKL